MPKPGVAVSSRPYNCMFCNMGYLAEGHLVEGLRQGGIQVTDLERADAVRDKILAALAEKDPLFFTAFGHGNETCCTDDNTNVFLDVSNAGVMAGRCVRLLSCLTAQQLGPALIQAGAVAYAGYAVEWTWMQDNLEEDPYIDKYAEAYYKSADRDAAAWDDGETWGMGRDASQESYQAWIDKWRQSDDPLASDVVAWLLWDMEGARYLGDMSATIRGKPVKTALVEVTKEEYTPFSKLVEVEEGLREMEVIGVRDELEIGRQYLWTVYDKETAIPLVGAEAYMDDLVLDRTDDKGNVVVTIPNPASLSLLLVISTVKIEVSRIGDPATARFVGYALDIPLPDAWWTDPQYILGTVMNEFSKELTYEFVPHIPHTLTTSVSVLVDNAFWHVKVTVDGEVKADQDIAKGGRIQATWIPGGEPSNQVIIRVKQPGYKDWEKQCTLVPPTEKEMVVEGVPDKVKSPQTVSITVKDKLSSLPLVGAAVVVNTVKVTETDINGQANFVL